MTTALMISLILVPALAGVLILSLPVRDEKGDRICAGWSIGIIALTVLLEAAVLAAYIRGAVFDFHVVDFTEKISILLRLDEAGAFFLSFIPPVWLLAGIFSLEYLKHEQNRKRFWGFYLLTLSSLIGLCLSGNLVTVYLFFEMMTLVSMPMVLHTQSHEAVMASLKYMFYSMAGAYMALFGLFVIGRYAGTLDFVPGGVLDTAAVAEHPSLILWGIFLMIAGFGVKAGMFPMHAWLPTAHPVAPAPASAVLSAIIVKGGVLAVIRSVFYIAGADIIRGTWVQYTWMILALFTVFMGSMLAYNEKVLKKRLAYSSVSQASYIMLGLSVLTADALTGSLLHVLFHALIKTALFLTVGAIIYKTGYTRVDQLRGIGKEMPIIIWCFTIVSLALIGIPPACGFISKWYLATGILNSGLHVYNWLGPVVLLVSALLTAGYLLPVTISGFLPGADYDYKALVHREPSMRMTVPLIILAAAAVILGIFPHGLISFLGRLAGMLV